MVHDWLYREMRESRISLTFRLHIDRFFRDLVEERVCPTWPSWARKPLATIVGAVCYGLVRLFGNYCARHGAPVQDVY